MNELINLSIWALISIGANLIIFLPAYFLKTDKLTDLSYAITFCFLVILCFPFHSIELGSIILASMILIWALRLGTYLYIRIQRIGVDDRFNEMHKHFWNYLGFWLLQGSTVFIVLIPSLLFLLQGEASDSQFSIVGIGTWAVGLLIETVADYQKFKFKSLDGNKDKWTNVGLWKHIRHPNYTGEILVWIGVYIFVLPSLSILHSIVALASPLFITLLLIFVSGIPLLEKSASAKWGHLDEYQKYKEKTGRVWPKF